MFVFAIGKWRALWERRSRRDNVAMNKTILVTGGSGYFGSHTCVELLESRYRVVLDDLSNSKASAFHRVRNHWQGPRLSPGRSGGRDPNTVLTVGCIMPTFRRKPLLQVPIVEMEPA